MKSFITFLLEYDVPGAKIDREPVRGTGTLFPTSLGYRHVGVEGFNPQASSLFHMTRFFPENMRIKPGIEGDLSGVNPRATLHFTRNGVVSDHMNGQWADASKFGIMMPEHRLINRVASSGSHDTWTVGGVELPTGSRVLVNQTKLDDADRQKFMKMFGVSSWEEAESQLTPWDPDKGVYGREVDFGGRKITFSGLQPDELAADTKRAARAAARQQYKDTTGNYPYLDDPLHKDNPLLSGYDPNSGLETAAHRHMRSVGISPVNIGQNYATGFVDRFDNLDGSKSGWGQRSDFDEIYGSRDDKKSVANYYRRLFPGVESPIATDDTYVPYDKRSPAEHAKDILDRLKAGTGASDHEGTVHRELEFLTYRDDQFADDEHRKAWLTDYRKRAQEGARDALREVLANPKAYHPSVQHPEAQAALRAQEARLTAILQGQQSTRSKPVSTALSSISKSLKGKGAAVVPLVLAGLGATDAIAKTVDDGSDFVSPQDALTPEEAKQIDSENKDKNKTSQPNTTTQKPQFSGSEKGATTMNDLLRRVVFEQKIPDSEDIEMEEMERLEKANAEDLKEYPGNKGDYMHNKLHKTIMSVVDKMKSMHK
jgi:hypothetical protein